MCASERILFLATIISLTTVSLRGISKVLIPYNSFLQGLHVTCVSVCACV